MEIGAQTPPDFLSYCFHVTAFCKTREEIDLLLAMLVTAKSFLPEVAIKTSITQETNSVLGGGDQQTLLIPNDRP